MDTQWYCRIMGEEWGPMSSQELVAVARRGRLTRNDVVRRGANGTWVRAENVGGLFNSPLPEDSDIDPSEIVAAVKAALPAKRCVRNHVKGAYWFRIGTDVLGPFTGRQLQQLAKHGLLRPFYMVSNDHRHWVRASHAGGLVFGPIEQVIETASVRSAVWLDECLASPDASTIGSAYHSAAAEVLVAAME
jgi:GYF domain 2